MSDSVLLLYRGVEQRENPNTSFVISVSYYCYYHQQRVAAAVYDRTDAWHSGVLELDTLVSNKTVNEMYDTKYVISYVTVRWRQKESSYLKHHV